MREPVTQTIASLILIGAAAAIPMSANPSGAAASPGGPDTLRGRPKVSAAGIPVVVAEMDSEPSSPASPEWLTEPQFRSRGASLLARKLTDLSLGVSWTRWGDHGRPISCEPFRGHEYSISFEDYWVYRCTEALAGGTVEYYTYFLNDSREPTLERARWSLTRTDLDPLEVRAIYEAVVDTLTHVHGPPTPSKMSGFGSVSWKEKWDFPRTDRVLTTYWVSTSMPSFVIELRSTGLRSTLDAEQWVFEEREETQDPEALRRDVVEGLRTRWPGLARAVETPRSSIADARQWREALARAQQGQHEAEVDRDLVHFAAHLWMLGFSFESMADTLVRRELESMRDLGVKLKSTHYVECCYRGSLLDSLIVRAGTNHWTDQAFLSFQEMGWEEVCDCGWTSFPGPDQFRPVIERGEAFLRDHPKSTVWNAVALTVAQGHETAWSLAMGRCEGDGIGWDWKNYVLEAPRHREQAIALYEKLLLQDPAMPALRSVSCRLQRLRLNVDTNYHPYWCVSD